MPCSILKEVPFFKDFLPSGYRIPIRIEIITVAVDGLPTIFIISQLRVCIPPTYTLNFSNPHYVYKALNSPFLQEFLSMHFILYMFILFNSIIFSRLRYICRYNGQNRHRIILVRYKLKTAVSSRF